MTKPTVWVLVDRDDRIVAGSVDDGTAEAVRFLLPVPRDCELRRVVGPVQMGSRCEEYLRTGERE